MSCRVSFPGSPHRPVELPEGASLSQHLTVQNSPVLFGCRTGVCGTCLVHAQGEVPAPAEDEIEVLELMAPGVSDARLCCQIDLRSDLAVRPL